MVDYHIVNCCRFDLGHDILMVSMMVVLLMLLQPDVARTGLLVVLESVALQTGHPVEDCWIVMLMTEEKASWTEELKGMLPYSVPKTVT